VIGNISGLSLELQKEINRVVKSTAKNRGLNLIFALNYGSKDEIVLAIKRIAEKIKSENIKIEDIDEKTIAKNLYTSGIPDPDLLIRTSGEKRISNFLLWQLAYSEFWYTDVLWPDFRQEDILEAILEYQKRNRRFGGI
jgi:undecaprenyl diphosphate synthase